MATPEGLKQDYKAKILTAEAYLYYLIKAKKATGWRWRFNVKEFCAEWGIAESTFYQALSKLRAKNLIFWRPGDNTIILWWDKEVTKIANVYSNDSANRPNPDTVMAPPDVAEQNAQALTVAKSCNNLLYTSLQFLKDKTSYEIY